jgi:hypothetical protein
MSHNPAMERQEPEEPDDPVPVFGSWPRIYAAVLIWLAVVMAAIALFQHWNF